MVVGGNDKVAMDIAEALGLKNARKITLRLAAGEIVTLEVEFAAGLNGLQKLPAILKKYQLVDLEMGKQKLK
jgi:hypothetical protein